MNKAAEFVVRDDGTWGAPYPVREPIKNLPFVSYSDIKISVAKPWLMKGVVARGETSSWIGPPGSGKSALLGDLGVHIAAGLDWRGYKSKEAASVVFLAFERGDLLKRRLLAYHRRLGLKELPIAVVTAPLDLMLPTSVDVMTCTIRCIADHFGVPVGLLVVDTFAKAIALGGGDENSAKDQNRLLGHLRIVEEETGVHIALIGHTGKEETRGARGSNAHVGDVDVMVQFEGGDVKTATITKANDQPEGPLTSFKIESFDFGEDDDGDRITTAIVASALPIGQKAAARPKLTPNQRTMFRLLHEAGAAGLSADEWNELARAEDIGVQRRATLSDIRAALKSMKMIKKVGDRWLVDHGSA